MVSLWNDELLVFFLDGNKLMTYYKTPPNLWKPNQPRLSVDEGEPNPIQPSWDILRSEAGEFWETVAWAKNQSPKKN